MLYVEFIRLHKVANTSTAFMREDTMFVGVVKAWKTCARAFLF